MKPVGRWFEQCNVFQVRLGYLKATVSLSSPDRIVSRERLARELQEVATRSVQVSLDRDPWVLEYFQRKRYAFTGRYGEGLALRDDRLYRGNARVTELPLEIQDYLLADPSVPSQGGAATPQVFDQLVDWAVWCELLRPENHSLTPRGVLCKAYSPADGFGQADLAKNPFKLGELEKLLWLYVLLKADGDVLVRLYPRLPAQGSFSRSEAGVELYHALTELEADFSKVARYGSVEYAKLVTLRGIVKSLKDDVEGRVVTRGGIGAKEQRVSVRLEPLVDVGVLGKSDKTRLVFERTAGTDAFVEAVQAAQDADLDAFIESRFFTTCARVFGVQASRAPADDLLEAELGRAYLSLRSSLGMAGIEEAAVAACASGLLAGHVWEIGDVVSLLKEKANTMPQKYRLNVDRFGRPRYFKITEPNVS